MKNTCIIILCLLIDLAVPGQHTCLAQLPAIDSGRFVAPPARQADTRPRLRQTNNEADMLLSLLFSAYKGWFSSQDLNSCTFQPSCSSYSMQALRKHGVVMGMLKTMDRLSRCHGLARELYETDRRSGLQIDRP